MNFQPRDYQQAIIDFIVAHPRANVWAGMGAGKTVSTLTAATVLDLIEPALPLLVIAPLRVAVSTWPDEVAKWAHLSHLRVSVIAGSAAERRRALATPADVYTINYENLTWLAEQCDDAWPFSMVVADESTKLKGFRLRQGTQRAKALARYAHRTPRWVNLTGTCSPNGIQDLWGQQWFVDQGQRLGRTWSAFTDRWFKQHPSGFGITPLPFAQAEVSDRLRDCCITITAADYLDLPPLVENTLHVDLPAEARRLYDEMERSMFAEIAGHEVEAFGAAARTNKCLQLAAGAVYVDDQGTWEAVHDAKLEALESVVEEAAGSPVLVAYQFRADLARILERFGKRARQLDRDPQTLRDWNAGRIPVLCAHPASAGHGLNLQAGGNILAYFTSGWNLEEDQQILERIGPTRQAQAGLNREVYVHRIVARDTVDELVAIRRQTKADVQEILLNAMKVKEPA